MIVCLWGRDEYYFWLFCAPFGVWGGGGVEILWPVLVGGLEHTVGS